MYSIVVRNINEALFDLRDVLSRHGQEKDNKNGPVLELPFPIGVTILNPKERCLFWPKRRWNPFSVFHESMWMMAGRNDVEWLRRYDASKDFSAAYGHRMVNHDMVSYNDYNDKGNQIKETINLLRAKPNTRQAVIQIWDYRFDGPFNRTLDRACSMLVVFSLRDRKLRMTIVNRSNDLLLGFCNVNHVQFSILHEYVAANIGARVGTYTHFSNCMYFHLETPEAELLKRFEIDNRYERPGFEITPLIRRRAMWDMELNQYMKEGGHSYYSEPWFEKVMKPLDNAWSWRKEKDYSKATEYAMEIDSEDIREAAMSWLLETQKNWEK